MLGTDMIDRVHLLLEPPVHGWMRVRLELDDFVLDQHVSRVLNDPIDELITVLRDAQIDPKPYVRACLWLEPAGFAIDVTRGSDERHCRVRIGESDRFIPPMQGATLRPVFAGEIKASRLRTATRAGLLDLLCEENAEALRAWRRDGDEQAYRARLRGEGPSAV